MEHPRFIVDRKFALLTGAIIIGVALFLAVLSLNSIERELLASAERNNIVLTRAFANVIWPNARDFVLNAGASPAETLQQDPKISDIRDMAIETMGGVPILKVKIYNWDGMLVFSTDTAEIGDDHRKNTGFLAARNGKSASKLTHKGTFNAFEQIVLNRDVLASYVPIRGANGSIEAVFEVYYDVTEILPSIKRAQLFQITLVIVAFLALYIIIAHLVRRRELAAIEHHNRELELSRKAMQAEESANKMKSAFLANMSHELRTPLNAILGYSEFMRMEQLGPLGSPKYLEYLDDIMSSGQHLLGIIGEVLDLSQIEAGKAELSRDIVHLPALVEESVHIVAPPGKEGTPGIHVSLASDLPAAYLDKRRFQQILINLLSNAVKFTPPTGRVEIIGKPATDGGIEICVADTGAGMQRDEIAVAMLPFGRVNSAQVKRTKGYGLGLPLTRSLVELHGGKLSIESEPGKGTKITIHLPAICAVEPAAAEFAAF